MNRVTDSHRCFVVTFKGPLTEQAKDDIKHRLLQGGADELEFTGARCSIRYPFPQLTREIILRMLSSPDTANGPTPVVSFYDSFITFMENNEHSHLVHTGGWLRNVEDIYIHNFHRHRIEREDIRKQTWRKYKES